MMIVTLDQVSPELADLVRRARAGEENIISDLDRPVARLVGLSQPASDEPRKPGALEGRLNLPDAFFFDPLPADELALWWGESQDAK